MIVDNMKATPSVRAYLVSRITTLKPTFERPPNLLRILRSLTFKQWMFFIVRPHPRLFEARLP
jgi:hypothetical protein